MAWPAAFYTGTSSLNETSTAPFLRRCPEKHKDYDKAFLWLSDDAVIVLVPFSSLINSVRVSRKIYFSSLGGSGGVNGMR